MYWGYGLGIGNWGWRSGIGLGNRELELELRIWDGDWKLILGVRIGFEDWNWGLEM